MTTAVESMGSDFAAIMGEPRVSSDHAVCASVAIDGVVPRHVVYPPAAEQVAAVLRCAAEHDLAVIPCRNTTKLGIGNVPRRYDVALSLKEMNRVWYYEPADLVVSVEPGMKFGDLQHFLARNRLWLPLDPAGGTRASIGGILATNSAGPLRVRYGSPRDMVLGMKIATTEGKIIKTGGRVVKNVAGYDLARLLVGSYGTLGVIVEASFKLYPLPPERATFVLTAVGLDTVRELRRKILDSQLQPLRIALLDARASALSCPAAGEKSEASAAGRFELWVEAGGSTRVIERYAREMEGLAQRSGASFGRLDEQVAEDAWARLSDLRTLLVESFPDVVIAKALLPLASGEQFLAYALTEARKDGAWLTGFGEPGVGVFRVCLRAERDAPGVLPLVERLRQEALRLGGALVVERAPVELKAGLDVWGPVGNDFEIMRKVKAAWDPKGILAPGRFASGL